MAARPVSGTIPNLVNGVSQQTPALRLPTQAEKQENFYSTIVEGLKHRPPTEFVAKLLSSLPSSAFTHVINRDVNERYIVVIQSGSVRVWDFDGNEKTVNAPDGYGYLTSAANPVADVEALTVADFTFVVNKQQTVAMDAATSPVRPNEAIVNVMEGNYSKVYQVWLNGALAGQYTTSASDPATLDTATIANALYTDMVTNGYNTAPWSLGFYHHTIHIQNSSADFTIEVQDGFNGHAMKAIKERTQHFADLPFFGPDGFVTEIIGDESTLFDNYWVKAETGSAGTLVWKECPKPGITLGMDATTMPFTLIREADGTFTFKKAVWDDRVCGDTEISPDPSFVGNKIVDVFFHRNRLGFLSGQNAIMSRSGLFFNFFRTSATTLLDDDPIDVGASHTKVSMLKHVVPYQRQLLIFTDETQFILTGSDTSLTPKNVSLDPLTEYVSDPSVNLLGLGQSVFFTATRGDWSAVWEYIIDLSSGRPQGQAAEVTDAAPSYIPAGVFKIAGTSNESVVVVLTSGDPGAFYVYKFYYSENKKLQSAWSRFSLPNVTAIRNAEFINSDLYLVVERADGVYLEKMRMQPAVTDDDIGFLVHLDQRVHTSQLAAPTYDAGTDTTTFTLPYATSSDIVAVTSAGNVDVLPALQLNISSISGNTVTLSGDKQTWPIWFGFTFESRYRFSTFFVRQQNGAGGTITVQQGRLQVTDMTLAFSKTAFFTVEVTPEGRATRTYTYTGRTLGEADNLMGVVPIEEGKKSIPILSRNDRVIIDIVNNSWMPSAFVNVIWNGKHSARSKDF